jgi:hypothetical protein
MSKTKGTKGTKGSSLNANLRARDYSYFETGRYYFVLRNMVGTTLYLKHKCLQGQIADSRQQLCLIVKGTLWDR